MALPPPGRGPGGSERRRELGWGGATFRKAPFPGNSQNRHLWGVPREKTESQKQSSFHIFEPIKVISPPPSFNIFMSLKACGPCALNFRVSLLKEPGDSRPTLLREALRGREESAIRWAQLGLKVSGRDSSPALPAHHKHTRGPTVIDKHGCTRMCAHTRSHPCVHTHVCSLTCIHGCTHAHTCTHTSAYKHVYVHTCTRTGEEAGEGSILGLPCPSHLAWDPAGAHWLLAMWTSK